MARARRTDSNGLAARWLAARARARTRRRCSFPSDNTASVTSRLLRPPRSASRVEDRERFVEWQVEAAVDNGADAARHLTVDDVAIGERAPVDGRQTARAAAQLSIRPDRHVGEVRGRLDLPAPVQKRRSGARTVPVIRRATTSPSRPRPARRTHLSGPDDGTVLRGPRQCAANAYARRSSRQSTCLQPARPRPATARSTRLPCPRYRDSRRHAVNLADSASAPLASSRGSSR